MNLSAVQQVFKMLLYCIFKITRSVLWILISAYPWRQSERKNRKPPPGGLRSPSSNILLAYLRSSCIPMRQTIGNSGSIIVPISLTKVRSYRNGMSIVRVWISRPGGHNISLSACDLMQAQRFIVRVKSIFRVECHRFQVIQPPRKNLDSVAAPHGHISIAGCSTLGYKRSRISA